MKTFRNISLLILLIISHLYSKGMNQDPDELTRNMTLLGKIQAKQVPKNRLIKAVEDCDLDEIVALLEKGVSVNIGNNYGDGLLHIAAENCNDEIVQVFLEYRAPLNGRNAKGQTPLMVAAMHKNREVVDLLLKYDDIEVNAVDNFKNTALIYAAGNSCKIAKALIEHGADVNYKGDEGRTALDIARENDNQNMIQLLQNAGAQ